MSSLFWKLFERGGRATIELVVQIMLARVLAPEDFGLLAILLVFVNLGNVVVQSGLNTALVQTPSADSQDFSTVFWLCLLVSLSMFTLIFFAAPSIAAFYGTERIVWPLRVLATAFLINALNSVQVAYVQRSLDFRKIFRATMVSVLISGVIGLTMAMAGMGLWALVGQQLTYQLTNCVVLSIQIDWRPKLVFVCKSARVHLSFGWKLLASGLLDAGYQSLSDLIIGKQFSTAQLGFVSQGKKYPQALGLMLDGAIQSVMLSAVSRVQGDITRVKRLMRRALKTSTFFIVPAMSILALVAEPLIRLVLGEQWLPAAPFFQLYCISYMLLPIHTANLQVLNGVGRSDIFLKLELIKKAYGVAILLFCAFVLKDVYLLVGSYILTGMISTLVNAWPTRKVIGYTYIEQIHDICPAFFLAAASVAVALPIGILAMPDIVQIVTQCVVALVVYLLLAKLFKVEELVYLMETARELLALKRDAKV